MSKEYPIIIRYMRLHEADAVVELMRLRLGDEAFTQHQVEEFISRQGNAGIIAIKGHRTIGFLLYTTRLAKQTVRICNILEHYEYDVVDLMLDKLLQGMPRDNPLHVEISVWERNIVLQQFLRRRGFKVVKTLPKRFGEDDGYLFRFTSASRQHDNATAT